MTKTQQKVWEIAVDVYGLDHNPYNTRTLKNVWRGWYTDEGGSDGYGWWADFQVAFGVHKVYLGYSYNDVKEWHQEILLDRAMEAAMYDE